MENREIEEWPSLQNPAHLAVGFVWVMAVIGYCVLTTGVV